MRCPRSSPSKAAFREAPLCGRTHRQLSCRADCADACSVVSTELAHHGAALAQDLLVKVDPLPPSRHRSSAAAPLLPAAPRASSSPILVRSPLEFSGTLSRAPWSRCSLPAASAPEPAALLCPCGLPVRVGGTRDLRGWQWTVSLPAPSPCRAEALLRAERDLFCRWPCPQGSVRTSALFPTLPLRCREHC